MPQFEKNLLAITAIFGFLITLRHREVEINKFKAISKFEEMLGVKDPSHSLPARIKFWHVFFFWKSSTSLFILRIHTIILIFAISYVVIRLLW